MIKLTRPTYTFDIEPTQVNDAMDRGPMMLTRVAIYAIDEGWRVDLSGYKLTKAGQRKTAYGWPIYNPEVSAEYLEAFLAWQASQDPTPDLSPQAWVDLASHLSCREADRVHAYLATRDAWTAQVFMEAHANSDDDEGDLHYQGGGADS
jgi:hypothetical protein